MNFPPLILIKENPLNGYNMLHPSYPAKLSSSVQDRSEVDIVLVDATPEIPIDY